MSVKTDKFSNLSPSPGEGKYVEFDEEFKQWGVFGDISGFCYSLWCSEEAKTYLQLTAFR